MKKIFCVLLALFFTYGAHFDGFLCYAGSKIHGVGHAENGKIKKNKKKSDYRQKKEIDMFVNYLAAKEDKKRRNKRKFVEVGSNFEKISVEDYLAVKRKR